MDWDQLKFFLYIAKSGSLARAARALQVNHSTVSRRINALEKQLQARLLEKGTQGIQLTPAGETLFQHALEMERQVNEAQQKLSGQSELICGTIKVTTEDTFGFLLLPDILDPFRRAHPHVVIDLNISRQFANLSHRQADVAVTVRPKPPEHLVGRNLGAVRMVLAASKTYLNKHGTPDSVKDLVNHDILSPNETLGHLKMARWLQKNTRAERTRFMGDSLLTLYHLAKKGWGVTVLPHYLVERETALVEIMALPDNCGSQAWVLTHPDRKDTLNIKTFIRYVGDHLKI